MLDGKPQPPLPPPATATALPTAAPPVVACYCSTGELGGVAALLLSDALRITVYNVCGGIINYYNQVGGCEV